MIISEIQSSVQNISSPFLCSEKMFQKLRANHFHGRGFGLTGDQHQLLYRPLYVTVGAVRTSPFFVYLTSLFLGRKKVGVEQGR